MALTKVTETSLLAIVSVSSNTTTVGSGVDVSTYYAVAITVRMGRGTGTAFTTAPICRIEGSYKASPTADEWVPICQFQADLGASIGSQAVSGTEAAGQTVVSLAAGTNFGGGDYVFFHNTTLANSEWSRVISIATADLTLEEAIVNAQTGSTCRDQAQIFLAQIDVTSFQRLRCVIDAHASGQASIWEAVFGAVSGL